MPPLCYLALHQGFLHPAFFSNKPQICFLPFESWWLCFQVPWLAGRLWNGMYCQKCRYEIWTAWPHVNPTSALPRAPFPSPGVRTEGPLSFGAYKINGKIESLLVNLLVIRSIVLSPAISLFQGMSSIVTQSLLCLPSPARHLTWPFL